MYKNIEAARTLGVSENIIRDKIKRKGLSKNVFNQLMQGKFTPSRPNKFFIERNEKVSNKLGKVKLSVTPTKRYFKNIESCCFFTNKSSNKALINVKVRRLIL